MPNPSRLDLVHKAICAGIGNIKWKDQAYGRVLDDPNFHGLTPKGIRLLLHEFCKNGGMLEVRAELRQNG